MFLVVTTAVGHMYAMFALTHFHVVTQTTLGVGGYHVCCLSCTPWQSGYDGHISAIVVLVVNLAHGQKKKHSVEHVQPFSSRRPFYVLVGPKAARLFLVSGTVTQMNVMFALTHFHFVMGPHGLILNKFM